MNVWAIWSLFQVHVAESAEAACLLGFWPFPLFLHPLLGSIQFPLSEQRGILGLSFPQQFNFDAPSLNNRNTIVDGGSNCLILGLGLTTGKVTLCLPFSLRLLLLF